MAGEHNFKIFNENNGNMMSDAEYSSDSQRVNGVVPGIAEPKLHNKLYRQCSVMAFALAQVLTERGFNAEDNNPQEIVNSIRRAFAYKVDGNTPDNNGFIVTNHRLDAYPVGSIYITTVNKNPADYELLGGGEWEQLKNCVLLAADDVSYEAGAYYGENSKAIPYDAMPEHSHRATIGVAGEHTHKIQGTTSYAGSHSHTKGTMNITGQFGSQGRIGYDEVYNKFYGTYTSGAFEAKSNAGSVGGVGKRDRDAIIEFSAKKTWTGSTSVAPAHCHSFSTVSSVSGGHSHDIDIATAGKGKAFNVMQRSYACYVWIRRA